MKKIVAIRRERFEVDQDTITRINVPVQVVGEKVTNYSFKISIQDLEAGRQKVREIMNNLSKEELIEKLTSISKSDFSYIYESILNGEEFGGMYDKARKDGNGVREAIDVAVKQQIETHLQNSKSVALNRLFMQNRQIMDFWQAIKESIDKLSIKEANNSLVIMNLMMPKVMLEMRDIIFKLTEETTEIRDFKDNVISRLKKGENLFITCPREIIETLFVDDLSAYDNYKGMFVFGLKDEFSHIKTLSYTKNKLLVGCHSNETYQRLVNAQDIMVIDNFLIDKSKIRKIIINSQAQDDVLALEAIKVNEKRKDYLNSFSGFSAQTIDGHSLDLAVSISPGDNIVLDEYYGTVGLVRNEIGLLPTDSVATCLGKKYKTFLQVMDQSSRADIVSRLSDITKDKADNSTNYQSVRFLLNTNEGKKILVRDIIVDLALSGIRKFTPTNFEPGSISILLPNIQNATEVEEISKVMEFCKKALKGDAYDASEEWIEIINDTISELRKADTKDKLGHALMPKTGPIRFDENIRIGAMIENPFAVRDAKDIRKQVDFYTMGLNDITWYHHVLFKTHPEFFEESEYVRLEDEGRDAFNGDILKKDVGSKLVNEDIFHEIARFSGNNPETIKAILEEQGVCDSKGNLLKTYREIQGLSLAIEGGILLSVIKKVLSRLAIGVDDIPGRENSQDYHEENMNFNPRILRTLAYAIKHFQSLDSKEPLNGGKFVEVCGDIPVKLIPFFVALKLQKISVYANQLQFTKVFVRNISYKESREELLNIFKQEETNNGVFNRLDRILGNIQSLFALDSEPEFITNQLKQHELDMDVIKELNRKTVHYRRALLDMNKENCSEILREVFDYTKDINSLKEALFIFQRMALREILGVTRIRTYDTVTKGKREFIRALYSSVEEGTSRFSGELVEGNKLKLNHFFIETMNDDKRESHYETTITDILEDENDGQQYVNLSTETSLKGPFKRINILVDNEAVYFELTKEALHREAIEKLDVDSELPKDASAFVDMCGKRIAYYTHSFKRSAMQVERNLHDVQLQELKKVINNDDDFAKVEQFLFGEKFVMEIYREGKNPETKKPNKRTVLFTDNSYAIVQELINKISSGKKLSVGEDGVCYLDGKKLSLMNDREDVFRARVKDAVDVRNLIHTKLLQEEEEKLIELKQAEESIRNKYKR